MGQQLTIAFTSEEVNFDFIDILQFPTMNDSVSLI